MGEVIRKKTCFDVLSGINVMAKIKTKNGFKYLPWSSAWAEVKKIYPNATYRIIPQIMDDFGNTRPWHDDGKSGWVEVGLTIDGLEYIEQLAIMNLRNQAIPAKDIMSTDANKAIKRCLTKACAIHGLGLYIYEGEELPEETTKITELHAQIAALVNKKCALSDDAKEKVGEICKKAEKDANPDTPDDAITGNFKNIEDITALETLKKRIMAVRK